MVWWAVAALVLGLLTPPAGIRAEERAGLDPNTLVIAADPWCPYNCEPRTDGREGYMIDILRAVFEPAGIKVDYQITNWSLVRRLFDEGKITATNGVARSERPDLIFPRQPLGRAAHALAFRRDSGFRYAGSNSLTNRRLAVIRGYDYPGELAGYVETHRNDPARVIETSGFGYRQLAQNLRGLSAGSYDLVIDNCDVLIWNRKLLRLEETVEILTVNQPDELHIVFSARHPRAAEFARLLDEGVQRLRKSGELQRILAPYGVPDWDAP